MVKVQNITVLPEKISNFVCNYKLKKSVYDKERGMGSYKAKIDDDALEFLADISNGDARNALNAIELGILTTDRSQDGIIHIDIKTAEQCIQLSLIHI